MKSQFRQTDYYCPHCQAPCRAEMWVHIDAGERPDLVERLLEGGLFDHACSRCGASAALDHSLLLVDAALGVAIANRPTGDPLGGAVDLSDPSLAALQLRTVADMNALRELAAVWRDSHDDATMLLLKHMVAARVLRDRGRSPMICAYEDRDAESLVYVLIVGESAEPEEVRVPVSAYCDLEATVAACRDELLPSGRWVDWNDRTAEALWSATSRPKEQEVSARGKT